MTKIIADPGSTHNGEFNSAMALVTIAADAGADAIKFQLLGDEQLGYGNIEMPWEWMPELIKHGKKKKIEVFASVFNISGVKYLQSIGCKSIKYPFSQQALSAELEMKYKGYWGGVKSAPKCPFDNIYSSCGWMDEARKNAINLFCIPEYPVPYQVAFDSVFDKFQGFSDHTLGISQSLRAAEAGAQFIEKHIRGDWASDTPDAKFAIKGYQLKELCKMVKNVKIGPK